MPSDTLIRRGVAPTRVDSGSSTEKASPEPGVHRRCQPFIEACEIAGGAGEFDDEYCICRARGENSLREVIHFAAWFARVAPELCRDLRARLVLEAGTNPAYKFWMEYDPWAREEERFYVSAEAKVETGGGEMEVGEPVEIRFVARAVKTAWASAWAPPGKAAEAARRVAELVEETPI